MLFAAQHLRTSSAALHKLSQHAPDTQAVAFSHTALAYIKPSASFFHAKASSRERGCIGCSHIRCCHGCRSVLNKRNLRQHFGYGSHAYAEDFFSPVHTCQLPHMCDFYHITLCYDVPFTRQGEQSYRLTNIGYD